MKYVHYSLSIHWYNWKIHAVTILCWRCTTIKYCIVVRCSIRWDYSFRGAIGWLKIADRNLDSKIARHVALAHARMGRDEFIIIHYHQVSINLDKISPRHLSPDRLQGRRFIKWGSYDVVESTFPFHAPTCPQLFKYGKREKLVDEYLNRIENILGSMLVELDADQFIKSRTESPRQTWRASKVI